MAEGPAPQFDPKAAIRERFTERAHHFAGGAGSDLPAVLELVRQLDLKGSEDVVDVATGGGALAIAMAPSTRQVTGVDLTPAMLDQARLAAAARDLKNVTFLEGDVENLPLPDAAFDILTCCRAVHHFLDMGRAFAEIRRVLRPGGRLGIVDFATFDDPEAAALLEELEGIRGHGRMKVLGLGRWPEHLRSQGFHLRSAAWFMQQTALGEWLRRVADRDGAAARVADAFGGAPARVRQAIGYDPGAEGGEPSWGRPYVVLVAERQAD
jgi:SAM-dependent methyltransferase